MPANGVVTAWSGILGRGVPRLVAAAVATAVLAGVWATAGAEDAHAFAWKDSCSITIINRTGAQSNIRPYLYLPFPPSPAGLALYAALAATGVPTNTRITFTNTGFPVTAGCTASLKLSNPGDNVSCGASAPTVGANSFNCTGNATFRRTTDNDDVAGDVFIPAGSGVGTSAPAPAGAPGPGASPPANTPSVGLLRRGDLAGRGWRSARKLADFGRLGQLVNTGTLPASCQDSNKQSQSAPGQGGTSAFARQNGAESVGALYGLYANAGQARTTLRAATSARSIRCLARLLSSLRLHTRVTIQDLSRRAAGAAITVHRLVIRTRTAGRTTRTDYLDVTGVQRGRANALVLLANARRPVPTTTEIGITRTVVRRLP